MEAIVGKYSQKDATDVASNLAILPLQILINTERNAAMNTDVLFVIIAQTE